MWAIHGSQRNAYGGPTREQYCCTHIPPCERKLKHEEHRKDRNQNSPSSPSYYEAVRQQVHTQWHSGTGTCGAWTMPKSQWQCPEYLR